MVRFLSAVLCALSVWGSTTASSTWQNEFRSKINEMPAATSSCSVCFYEQSNFKGQTVCIGKRPKTCTIVNPIQTPGTIGSIKFGGDCELVVNARVTVLPYGERVDAISADVESTGYESVVQEVYVEEAGRACFLGVPTSGHGYGRCYTGNVPVVERQYCDAFNELLVFKTSKNNFDVIAYEKENFNRGDSNALSQRFTQNSKNLETDKRDNTGMMETMRGKVRSITIATTAGDSYLRGRL